MLGAKAVFFSVALDMVGTMVTDYTRLIAAAAETCLFLRESIINVVHTHLLVAAPQRDRIG